MGRLNLGKAIDKMEDVGETISTLIPPPGPNGVLPPLNPFKARSTYAMILTLVLAVCGSLGIDLFAWTSELGLGANEDELVATGEQAVSAIQVLLNIGAGIWLWVERRAPNFRLSFKSQ